MDRLPEIEKLEPGPKGMKLCQERIEAAKLWRVRLEGLDELTDDERELARQALDAQIRKSNVREGTNLDEYVVQVQADQARKRAKAEMRMKS
jgi:hypothetical protein